MISGFVFVECGERGDRLIPLAKGTVCVMYIKQQQQVVYPTAVVALIVGSKCEILL